MTACVRRMLDEGGWVCQPVGTSKSIASSPCVCGDPPDTTSPREEIGPTGALSADGLGTAELVSAAGDSSGAALGSPRQPQRHSRRRETERTLRFIAVS